LGDLALFGLVSRNGDDVFFNFTERKASSEIRGRKSLAGLNTLDLGRRRTISYFVSGNITVQATSSLIGFDSVTTD